MRTPRTSTNPERRRRCLFKPGDIAVVVGGHGIPFKRVVILDHLLEPRGAKFYYHRYTVRYLDGPHQGTVRKFHAQDLIPETEYPWDLGSHK